MVEESTITRKIRIYPNKEQRKLLKQCFIAHRYFYNQSVEFIRNPNNKKESKSAISLKKKLKIRNGELKHEWMRNVPFDTRDEALRKASVAFKTGIKMVKQKKIAKFHLNFLSRKRNNDVCYVNPKAFKNSKLFVRKLRGKSKIKGRKKAKRLLNRGSDGIFPIIKHNGKYYMCLNFKVERKSENINSKDGIVALDPGIRCFQTYFSQRECGTIGDKMNLRIRNINSRIDKLESLKTKTKGRVKYNISKRCKLLRSKITNIINDLHWKCASFLTRRYKVILLPRFGVKSLSKNISSKKVNRELYNLSHFKFKMRLKEKALQHNCKVIECCESYTTQTCTCCGVPNNNIGSKKLFACKSCHIQIDRDLNGARNVFIRSLTKYYSGLDTIR